MERIPKASGLTNLSPSSTFCSAFAMESVFSNMLEKSGPSCKCSQASSASSDLSGAGQPSGRRSFSGVLVLEQLAPLKATERTEWLLPYSQLFLGCRQCTLSTSRLFVTLHQQYPKGPPPTIGPHRKDAPNLGRTAKAPAFLGQTHAGAGALSRMSNNPERTRNPGFESMRTVRNMDTPTFISHRWT